MLLPLWWKFSVTSLNYFSLWFFHPMLKRYKWYCTLCFLILYSALWPKNFQKVCIASASSLRAHNSLNLSNIYITYWDMTKYINKNVEKTRNCAVNKIFLLSFWIFRLTLKSSHKKTLLCFITKKVKICKLCTYL